MSGDIRPLPQTPEEIAQEQWREQAAIDAANAVNREYDESTMTDDQLDAIINCYTKGDIRASVMALIIVIEGLCQVVK